jgi:hypothetical protein
MPYRKPTGALLKVVRPDTYRQVVELLAEPREQVSYREIERVCRVGGDTIKAVERVEAATITERKARMLQQVTRVAERAWQTVEDKLDGANLTQATICAGVATEKMLLLAGEATHRVEVVLADASDLYSEMASLKARLEADGPVIDAELQSLPTAAPVPQLQSSAREP